MERESFLDDLTGLYNRRYLNHWVDSEISRSRRYDLPLSIALIDLDNFKRVNDTKGHLFGDTVLREFSEFLRETLRSADVIVRYGGDEFIIVLPNTGKEQAVTVMQRIIEEINEKKFNGIKISASCGISYYPEDGEKWDSLFENADRRMYHAKRKEGLKVSYEKTISTRLKIPTSRLVGRKNKINKIRDLIENREKGIIMTKGEAGVGKTRLVSEFVQYNAKYIFVKGNSYPAMNQAPYYAIRDLLGNLLKEENETIHNIFVNKLSLVQKKAISGFIPELSRSFSDFTGDRLMLFDTVRKFLDLISEEISFAILFDDLHWASTSTVEILYFILKSRENWYPVFGTYRTEEIEESALEEKLRVMGRDNLYSDIHLKTLDKNSTEEMVTTILGEKISDELSETIYRETGGNPFFVEEIIKELHDKGALVSTDYGYRLDKDVDIKVPSSIKDTVIYKISLLDERTGEVLKTSAVIGRSIDFALLGSITEINEGELYDILDNLINLNLLEETEPDKYRFTEDVFRQVILDEIPQGTLSEMHLEIAENIEEKISESREKIEMLAHHYHYGGNRKKVVKYGEKGGDIASNLYAHEEAIKLYRWALEGELEDKRRASIYRKIGNEATLKGDYETAVEELNKALEYTEEDEFKAEIYKELGNTYTDIGNYKEAYRTLRQARKLYPEHQQKYSCDPTIGWVYMKMGKLRSAKRCINRVLENLNRDEYKKEYSLALNTKATLLIEKGKYEKALELYDEAREIREEIGYKERVGSLYLNSATVYQEMNELDRAKEYYERALKLYRNTGFKEGEIITLANLGSLEINRNNLNEAERNLRKALSMAEWVDGIARKVSILRRLGFVLILKGTPEKAIELFKQAERDAGKTGSPETLFFLYISLTRVYVEYLKNIEEAEKYLEKAENIRSKIERMSMLTYFSLVKVTYYLQTDQIEKGINELKDNSLPLAEKHGNAYNLFHLYNLWAVLYAKKGWYKWGKRYLEDAMKYAKETDDNSSVAHVHARAGDFWSIAGEKEKAEKKYRKALKIYRDLGLNWYSKNIESRLEELNQ